MSPEVPEWVKHAVFYQIFPDRFSRSSRTRHPRGTVFRDWDSEPTVTGFHGGDLRGVTDRLDYLESLGVNALYLNPVFASASNHRYHTWDYFSVDPLLGGNDALRELLDRAHSRGMRVVLDGVFNHTGRGFWAFHHVLENGPDSPYTGWFNIDSFPLIPYPGSGDETVNYECWADLPALPRLDTANPAVRDYIYDVARRWIEFGIDGWRLDVPEDIRAPGFWEGFREVVKRANPEAWLCGEVWHVAPEWLRGDRFDGLMNYPFALAALGFFGRRTLRENIWLSEYPLEAQDAGGFARAVERFMTAYGPGVPFGQLNLLGSHDTARALWMAGGDTSALRLAVLFQMTMPGAPCIYYGDEVGMSGGYEPANRGAFPWEGQESWDTDLLEFFRRATALRREYPVLREGSFRALHAGDDVYVFAREHGNRSAIVALNASPERREVRVEPPGPAVESVMFRQVWPEAGEIPVEDRELVLRIPAREGLVAIRER